MNQRSVPKLDFRQIKQSITLPDVLEKFGILDQFELRRHRLNGPCPLHEHTSPIPNRQQFKADCRQDGKTWQWHCFGDCQSGGDILKFILILGGFKDYRQVRLWIWQHFADRLRDGDNGNDTGTKKAGEEMQCAATKPPSPTVEASTSLPARPHGVEPLRWSYKLTPSDYLISQRNFQPETLAYFGGVGIASKGWARGRIAIPLHWHDQADGEHPVSYLSRFNGDRVWDDEHPKYQLFEDFPRQHFIYGLGLALRNSPAEQGLIIVEGVTDVWRLTQEAGLRNAVATLGSAMSDEQAQLLAATHRDLTVMFDGNAHKQARAAAAKLMISGATSVRVIDLPADSEPDHLNGEQIRRLLPRHF